MFFLGKIGGNSLGFKPYTQLENIELTFDPDNIVVEIGSENGEGSSIWLYDWAKERNIDFYSIDVEHRARERIHPEINWVVTRSGSSWCQNVLPGLNKKIKVLYLDNFDWTPPEHASPPDWIQNQIQVYKKRGIEMNNQNCQEEHRLQMQYCLPYMDKQSVVIMDDTWYNSTLDTWDGKCATVVPLLLENNFNINNSTLAIRNDN